MKWNRCAALLCAGALTLGLAGCGAAGTDANTNTNTDGQAAPAAAAALSLEGATAFTFTDGAVAVSEGDYAGYALDGTVLTIDGAGTYVLTGQCGDGSVTVKKGTTGVTLVLNGLELNGGGTAAIVCGKSTEVVISAAAGSVNALSDSAENNDESYPDNTGAENAVIKCKDGSQVTLCGTGSLTVSARGRNGIKSGASTAEEGEASLTIRELTLTIDAPVNDAVNAEQQLTVESGTLTIAAGDDALHSDLALTIGAAGTDGPDITITACYEGIEGAVLTICSGRIDITAEDDCLNAANGDLSGYDFSMTISGGSITAYSAAGDGFDSNGDLTISGGTVAVWTANSADNQPLDADGTITVSGGTVLAAGGSAGMGMRLSAEQPCVSFSGHLGKGSAFAVSGEGGEVYSGTAMCDAAFVFLSAPELTAGGSYDLTAGGDAAATAAAQSGSVQAGAGGGPFGGKGGGDFPADRGQRPAMPDGMTPPEKRQ